MWKGLGVVEGCGRGWGVVEWGRGGVKGIGAVWKGLGGGVEKCGGGWGVCGRG